MTYSITEAVPFEYETFKIGKEGWPIVVCQNTLNSHYKTPPLVLDGYFGPKTENIAREVQAASHVVVDGILGPESQEAFVRAKCKHAEKEITPPGLLIGICKIESSCWWAAVSPVNDNGTHDYGVTQESLADPTAAQLLVAFNPDAATHILAHETHAAWSVFVHKVNSQFAWECAALNHNWPVAAEKLANGEHSWLDKPFAFTTAKGYATGLDYCNHYISEAISQVTDWTVI